MAAACRAAVSFGGPRQGPAEARGAAEVSVAPLLVDVRALQSSLRTGSGGGMGGGGMGGGGMGGGGGAAVAAGGAAASSGFQASQPWGANMATPMASSSPPRADAGGPLANAEGEMARKQRLALTRITQLNVAFQAQRKASDVRATGGGDGEGEPSFGDWAIRRMNTPCPDASSAPTEPTEPYTHRTHQTHRTRRAHRTSPN